MLVAERATVDEDKHAAQPFARRRVIVEHVRANRVASLHDLAELTRASEATIRRDLRMLDEQGLLVRHRGGASRGDTPTTPPVADDVDDEPGLRTVAALAAAMVRPDDAIAVGAGPSARALAHALAEVPGLTVVTNALVVAVELAASDAEVILTGGSTQAGSLALVGPVAEASLRGIRVSYAFLPADGLSAAHGLSVRTPLLASVTRELAETAREVVALAPATTLGRDATIVAVPSEGLAHVVTDTHDATLLRPLRGGPFMLHAPEA